MVDWSGGVFASCMPRVQLYVNAYNGWPQFALQHHWLLPINCHFLRLYSAAGRGTAAVSSAIEESDLYLFYLLGAPSHIPWLYGVASCESWTCIIHVCVCVCVCVQAGDGSHLDSRSSSEDDRVRIRMDYMSHGSA